MATEQNEALAELIKQANEVPTDTALYWKLRALYKERIHDTTYSEQEQKNCFHLWRILMRREK